jgi:hypothetical protein
MTSYIATKDETVSWYSSYKEEMAKKGGPVIQQKILERLREDTPSSAYMVYIAMRLIMQSNPVASSFRYRYIILHVIIIIFALLYGIINTLLFCHFCVNCLQ